METVIHELVTSTCEFTGDRVGYCDTCYSPDFDSYSGTYTDYTNWTGTDKDIAYGFYEHVLNSEEI